MKTLCRFAFCNFAYLPLTQPHELDGPAVGAGLEAAYVEPVGLVAALPYGGVRAHRQVVRNQRVDFAAQQIVNVERDKLRAVEGERDGRRALEGIGIVWATAKADASGSSPRAAAISEALGLSTVTRSK